MKTSPLTFVPMLTTPLWLFLIFWFIYGLPTEMVISMDYFWLQTCMTLLTIFLVPSGLKFITREKTKKLYFSLCVMRMSIFQLLVIVNEVFYFTYTNTAFLYLGLIVWASMLFCFPTKEVVKPVVDEQEEQKMVD